MAQTEEAANPDGKAGPSFGRRVALLAIVGGIVLAVVGSALILATSGLANDERNAEDQKVPDWIKANAQPRRVAH